MTLFQAIIIAIIEGLTEFLPISSTGHMVFASSYFNIQNEDFVQLFQVAIQFGAIMAVVVLYWKKFFDFSKLGFYLKLMVAVIPALLLGFLFDEKIETLLGNPIPIALALIIGGIFLLFIDNLFETPTIFQEEQITIQKATTIGFWQCLAMMPGISRSAASIIGGMQQGLSRSVAAEFSFFLAVPTMFAAASYSVFIKRFDLSGLRGYELINSNKDNFKFFILGNIVAFVVALLAIKLFIGIIKKYGFKPWAWYRIIAGIILLLYFSYN